MQEGKQKDLGAISDSRITYWGQNKGRPGRSFGLATKIMAILFMVLAIVLNMKF